MMNVTGKPESASGADARLSLPPALILGLLIALGMMIAVRSGAVVIADGDWSSLFFRDSKQILSGGSYVLWNIRLPRALFSLLIGAAMGMAGALTQGLFRNPLADPGLLGVSAGAACVAALSIVLFGRLGDGLSPDLRLYVLPLSAFAGALTVCFVLDRVARWIAPGSISGLLLCGIALNALAAAVIGLCTFLATDEQLRSLSFWTLGSLAGANWLVLGVLAGIISIAWWRVRSLLQAMNALALGEAAASHVGIDVRYLRTNVIGLVAVLSGFAVAWCGMIGFIGLVAPHMVRTWIGADQRQLIPMSMLMGGLLLLLADTVARSIAIPAEIPVGIFTALLGAPFFLTLLSRSRGRIG